MFETLRRAILGGTGFARLGSYQIRGTGFARLGSYQVRGTGFARLGSYQVRCSSCEQGNARGGKTPEELFFFSFSQRKKTVPMNKVTVVGVGQVGMACAVSCLYFGVTTDLCLYDVDQRKTLGEAMDLQQSSLFLKGARVTAAKDLSETAHSRLVIVTAGARQKDGEQRPQLMGRNVEIFKAFIPDVVQHSPDCILLIVSNPCDALTYVAWKLSGLPVTRVVGSGTNLDTSRFRYLIAEKMNVNPKNCHGYVVGEHGDSSVPVWSGVNVSGVPLRTHLPEAGSDDDDQQWRELHERTVRAAYDVIRLKGYTSWAIGFSVGQISEALLKNTLGIHCVSTSLRGHYEVEDDVFASVPCILGDHGVLALINLPLTRPELGLLHKSVNIIRNLQTSSSL